MKLLKAILVMTSLIPVLSSAQEYHEQSPTNWGLKTPLPKEALPYSRTGIMFPERKAKTPARTKLIPVRDNAFRISGGWEMTEGDALVKNGGNLFGNSFDTSSWYNATVPGTVLTTLVEQGVYPDPYFGVNNMAIPENLHRKDWWYRAEFTLTPDMLNKDQIQLLFNGINYEADIWLNGEILGNIKGAFIRGQFDMTALAKEKNILAVHIHPSVNPGIPHEQSSVSGRGPNGGVLCLDGPTFISSEGWDWVPGVRDRNLGIWQDVQVIVSDALTIGDTQVVTDLPLPKTDYADITVSTTIRNSLSRDRNVRLHLTVDGKHIYKDVAVKANSEKEIQLDKSNAPDFHIINPRLWMPNGYGNPNLYTMHLECSEDGKVSDSQDVTFEAQGYNVDKNID